MYKTSCSLCEFNEDTQIFVKHYFGTISLDQIKASWIELIEHEQIPRVLNGVIINYSDSHLDVPLNMASEIPKFYKEYLPWLMEVKIAVVVSGPHDVVIPILVGKSEEGKFSKPFSSIEAAEEWILGSNLK